jgi:hypothetical protein
MSRLLFWNFEDRNLALAATAGAFTLTGSATDLLRYGHLDAGTPAFTFIRGFRLSIAGCRLTRPFVKQPKTESILEELNQ